MTGQAHYGNRYATIVGMVRDRGRMRLSEIASEVGLSRSGTSVYLARAIQRGHLYRPEYGVYSASESSPTSHWHEICELPEMAAPSPQPADTILTGTQDQGDDQ